MPVLPLYIPWEAGVQTDSWRQVRIPGGFECWRFKTYEKNGISVELDFSLGLKPSGRFCSRYRHWLRRPTRNRPPVSMDEPSVGMVIWKKQGRPIQIRQRVGREKFQFREEKGEVRIGSSTLSLNKNASALMRIEHFLLSGTGNFEKGEDLHLLDPPLYDQGMGPFLIARRRYRACISLASSNGTFDPVHIEGEAEYEHWIGHGISPGFGSPGWTFEVERYERAVEEMGRGRQGS